MNCFILNIKSSHFFYDDILTAEVSRFCIACLTLNRYKHLLESAT